MKRLGIVYDNLRVEEKALINAAKRKDVELDLINCTDLILDLNHQDRSLPDLILQRTVSYFRSLHTTAVLEYKGKRVVNRLFTSIYAGNKLFTHLLLTNSNIPTPRSLLTFSYESALKAIEKLGYPVVLKPTIGSWGRLIALIKDRESAEAILESREYMFPLYQVYYIEEFVKRPPRDIRAIVIGDQLIAAIYRYSAEGRWKTNMALGGKAEPCPITKELEDICIKTARVLQADIAGIDLMESEDRGLLVHEVNNTTEFKNVARVNGIDIGEKIIDYVLKC